MGFAVGSYEGYKYVKLGGSLGGISLWRNNGNASGYSDGAPLEYLNAKILMVHSMEYHLVTM